MTRSFRTACLAGAFLFSAAAWTTWSPWSPGCGWVADFRNNWRVSRLRAAAVPPCEITSWREAQAIDGIVVTVPACYRSTTKNDMMYLADESSALPIVLSVFRGATDTWMVSGQPSWGWTGCGGETQMYCLNRDIVAVGGEFALRHRLAVMADGAILVQSGVPSYLKGTSVDVEVVARIEEMIRRSRMVSVADDRIQSDTADVTQWVLPRVVMYGVGATSTWIQTHRSAI